MLARERTLWRRLSRHGATFRALTRNLPSRPALLETLTEMLPGVAATRRCVESTFCMSEANFIQRYQRQWFERIRPYLANNNLNVGSGLGYFSRYAEEEGVPIISLEIAQHLGALPLRNFALYDGRHMPFEKDAFEVSIAMYVLHHTPDYRVVLSEMKIVTTKRVILVEELYVSLFGKVRLVLLDLWINFKLRQNSPIHWRSYFRKEAFRSAVEGDGWKLIHLESNPRGGFDEVRCFDHCFSISQPRRLELKRQNQLAVLHR